MALFTKLLNLHSGNIPLENFFTEIFVCFLQHNQAILIDWLKSHSIINEETYSRIEISSQEKHSRLPNQNEDSIIDIQVKLENGIYRDLIFIESKIGAKDGNDNLKKYAEILSSSPNIRHRILIYITRDYDPKQEIKTFASNLSPQVSFYELKWQEFYDFLNNHEDDSLKLDILKREILNFMKDNQMFQQRNFSDIDILSMITYRKSDKTFALINNTLNDEVRKKFSKNFGFSKPDARSSAWKNYGVYGIKREISSWHFVYFLGYFDYTPENSTEYPNIEYLNLGVSIGVAAKYEKRKLCIDSMDNVIKDKHDKWILREFDGGWRTIDHTIKMQGLLDGKDDLQNIRDYFLESINELKEVHDKYFYWNNLTIEKTTQEVTEEYES